MKRYFEKIKDQLNKNKQTWLITGVAGFIGSNILETLLNLNQKVIGLDNFSTGFQKNLDMVKDSIGEDKWNNFKFIQGDVRNPDDCKKSCENADYVLHQAALGSVPRSVENPMNTNDNNITGFLNMLWHAKEANVKSFVYAASSSTYGDHPGLPKVEDKIGSPLSPYAVTKYVNELYADVFAKTYGFKTIGLRYFNVFGKRQTPDGAYAAVIPKWFAAMIKNQTVFINGDGETSRDFCYIDNCIQANILSALAVNEEAKNQVYNVAFGQRTTLNELFELIKERVSKVFSDSAGIKPEYRDFRAGDVRHSLADISKAVKLIGYSPAFSVEQGLDEAAEWYIKNLQEK